MTDAGLGSKAIELIVDLSTGYVVERLAEPALTPTWEVIKSVLFPRWDGAREKLRLNLQDAIDRKRAQDSEFTERLRRSLRDGEAGALAAHFVREAAQATTTERMQMLAQAAAGVFTPDLNSEMRSRVARAVADLEPSDVVTLRRCARAGGIVLRSTLNCPHDAYASLLAAGCLMASQRERPRYGESRVLMLESGEFAGEMELEFRLDVTHLGTCVLRALDEWQPESQPVRKNVG